ncbi:MAG TPA: DUF3426 domain-containing protein [Gallionella sp.]|nr:DUF3426 domain-containing protein [Gallionella sp.]
MDGTTLCPHCDTRFRIAGTQLEAHQGMVRCGSCMQAFDARPGFIPDQPDPQLELPILEDQVTATAEPTVAQVVQAPESPVSESPALELVEETPQAVTEIEFASDEAVEPVAIDAAPVSSDEAPVEPEHDGSLDFSRPADASADEMPSGKPLVIQPALLAGSGPDEEAFSPPPRTRRWPWIIGLIVLLLLLCAQAAYFFRIELAARLPGMKPALVSYCKLLNCSVPLPQNAELMSIESSELEADPEHDSRITLVALLRNRASHAQAFPHLELSLNDTEDKVLARRTFKPADYLPATESEAVGLKPNHELNIRLKLDTTDLRPTGYRLALFYPQ